MASTKLQRRERAIRRMRTLPEAVKARAKVQMRANAEELAALMRRRAPVKTGALRDSIRVEDHSDESGIRFKVKAGGRPTMKKVRSGVQRSDFLAAVASALRSGRPANKGEYDYAVGTELGNSQVQAQPFFYPSARQTKKRDKRRLNKAAKDGIGEALRTP